MVLGMFNPNLATEASSDTVQEVIYLTSVPIKGAGNDHQKRQESAG